MGWFLSKNDDALDVVPHAKTMPQGKDLISTLTINLRNTKHWEYNRPHIIGRGCIETWKEFHKWFYGRPQSEHFVMSYKNSEERFGEDTFLRSEIVRFSICVREKSND